MRQYVRMLVIGLGLLAVGGAAARAMPSAEPKESYEAGGAIGASVPKSPLVAGSFDVAMGAELNGINRRAPAVTLDFLSTGDSSAQSDPLLGHVASRVYLTCLGGRIPLNKAGATPFALDFGATYLRIQASGAGYESSNPGMKLGPNLGLRTTMPIPNSADTLNLMFRQHWVAGGVWQVGAGFTHPLGAGTGLKLQVDYYHLGGGGYSGANAVAPGLGTISANSDTVLVGIRWRGSTE